MKKFFIYNEWRGYANKKDITNLDSSYLIPPSKNVIINDGEKVVSRPGYTLYGASSADLYPIESSHDWITSTGTEYNLRAYDDKLEFNYNGTFYTLVSGLTSVEMSFTSVWDSTEKLDLLLFVNGDSNINMWSGAVTTFASATATTITKQGTNTFAQDRFLKTGTRKVVINGTTYTYTGGEGTTTLTGVTPDPTLAGHAVGSVVFQEVRVTSSTPGSGFNNNIIGVLKNQVYVGDYKRRDVFVSKNTSFADYTFTSPVRLPGEGALLTLDSTPIAFATQEEDMYISTVDGWFKTSFTLSNDLTKEDLKVQKLKTDPLKGALAQQSVCKVQNAVVFFTRDKTIDFLGRIENITTPESKPISDIIKLELLSYDVTIPPHLHYIQSKLYAFFPSESKCIIYDFEKKYWNPPQILPIRRGATINKELYGHSSLVPETYKLFDEDNYSDNSNPIDCHAEVAYDNTFNFVNFPAWQKTFNEYYNEGYIGGNTVLNVAYKLDYKGYTSIVKKRIDGSDSRILFASSFDGSLGKYPLGHSPLGSVRGVPDNLKKFRVIHTFKDQDYYEFTTAYSTNQTGARWELLRRGGNIELSKSDNTAIKIND